MYKLKCDKLVLVMSCLLGIITANASTFMIDNKACNTEATYETVSSTRKIQIKDGTFSATSFSTQKGVVKAHTDKAIKLILKDNSKVQIIFIHYIKNGGKVTMQSWLTDNKICQIGENPYCDKINYEDIYKTSNKEHFGIKLCTANKPN